MMNTNKVQKLFMLHFLFNYDTKPTGNCICKRESQEDICTRVEKRKPCQSKLSYNIYVFLVHLISIQAFEIINSLEELSAIFRSHREGFFKGSLNEQVPIQAYDGKSIEIQHPSNHSLTCGCY